MNRHLRKNLQGSLLAISTALLAVVFAPPAFAVSLSDGFGDADRNNSGSITAYDTDKDLSGAIDGTEVTTAENASDTGIIWTATRGFTSSNTGDPKPNLKIIDDNVAIGSETAGNIHNSGLALGWEAKGSGSSAVGFFGQSIVLGPNIGDKIVVSFDWRNWRESNNPTGAPNPGELRWGLFQDTDSQFGMTNNEGLDSGGGQALVTWGPDTGENDGSWRDADPGPKGDRGIWNRVPLGPASDPTSARINYEYNLPNINGTSNNARFLEGSGVSNTVGEGGDVGTVASTSDGPGGNVPALVPHNLSMEIIRVAATGDSTGIEIATFINGSETLRDDIKTTDTGASVLGAPPESFDYIALRNTGSAGDFDFVIDNFSIANVAIPEPSSILLLGFGSTLAFGMRRRR